MSNQSAASRVQANLQELFKSNLDPGNSYIKFELTSDITALLSMEQVQESIVVRAEQITTIPGMPKSALGMINSRDRVFCVFDMAQLLGLPSNLTHTRQYQIIVFQAGLSSILVGFAVGQLQGIQRLLVNQIELPSQDVVSNFNACVSGVVKGDRSLSVLDLSRILNTLTDGSSR